MVKSAPRQGKKGTKGDKGDKDAEPKGRIAAYIEATRSPMTAAALTLPLLSFYGLGSIFLEDTRNGVDIVSTGLSWLFASLDAGGWRPYALFYGILILVNLGLIAWLKRSNRFDGRYFLPLLAECGLYAIATGTLSAYLTHNVLDAFHLLAVPLSTGRSIGPIDGLFVSAGAGLHEELVFRLIGIGAVARLALGPDWRARTGRLLAIVVISSLVFSAVHHVVEPFRFSVFVFRTFAGLLFAALFLGRGFAVAAWTHALYDVWVIVVLGR
jgi:hypothetical protein